MKKFINLMLVDDHQMVLEGLKSLLHHDSDVGINFACTRAQEAIDYLMDGNNIDVILLDINLPGMNGFELCKLIKRKYPAIKIIALSTHQERSAVTRMLQNGASGFLSKSADGKELSAAIHAVAVNGIYLGAEVQQEMTSPGASGTTGLPKLTRREKEILTRIAEGKTTAQIAKTLFLSHLTVETHRRNIMQKYDVNNVAALIRLAMEQGMI
jgi:DNA-binding NarL/FixJ family response regulator